MDKWFKISGWQGSVLQEEIPVLPYADFFQQLCRALERESCHIASYFGVPESDALRLYCLMLDDASGEVMIASCLLEGCRKDQVSRTTDSQDKRELIPSLTARYPAVHPLSESSSNSSEWVISTIRGQNRCVLRMIEPIARNS